MKTALYLRVSTNGQDHRAQLRELHRYCKARGWRNLEEFVDRASGAKTDRQGLDQLMAAVRTGKIKRVVVFKLDRLGRSLAHLVLVLTELQAHGVALLCTSQGIDTSSDNPAGRLQLNVLMAVAEFERTLIRERVNAGLAAARARVVQLGRPVTVDRDQIRALRRQGLGVREIARRLKVSPSTVSAVARR